MRILEDKIKQEIEEVKNLSELSKDAFVNFHAAMRLYEKIEDKNNKIKFLKNLNKAMKVKKNEDIKRNCK